MISGNRKRCPNCGAMNPSSADECLICGATIGRQRNKPSSQPVGNQRGNVSYQAAQGEDDLLARGVMGSPLGAFIALSVMMILLAGIGFALLTIQEERQGNNGGANDDDNPIAAESRTPTATVPSATPFPTNTRPAPQAFPTVTPLPATNTPIPTQGPCIRTAASGDTLYGLAQQCGHRNFSIVDVIVEANPELECAQCLREGQTVEIPYPTPTIDPNAANNDTTGDTSSAPAEGGSSGTNNVSVAADDDRPENVATFFVEPTLRPGLKWYTVVEGDNLITIASQHNADAKILSDINPEIDFAQCDFGMRYGGENCTVIFYQGQRVRVPAPTPTPTLSATPSGSETPTPTYTPTFNVPILMSPEEDAIFDASSLITLRWSATGSLAPNEVYQITFRDVETDDIQQGRTTELFYVVPEEWQPEGDELYAFEWMVEIAVLDGDTVLSTRELTEPRVLNWQGR